MTGGEFPVACTQYDKLLVVSKDGHYKVMQIEEKAFVGTKVIRVEHPDKESIYTMVYQTADACYIKRFAFGGTIMNKEYTLIPGKKKGRIVYLEKGTPDKLYIRYKPVPRQKINQQTCKPKKLTVKGPKTKGKQISIKSISNIGGKPPKNWEEDAATTEVLLT